MYDAYWQGFSYWLIGTMSNSAERAAILVASYKTFQATGAAMAWRLTALEKPALTQLGVDWGLCTSLYKCSYFLRLARIFTPALPWCFQSVL